MRASRTADSGGQSVWAIDPTHTTVAFTAGQFFFFKLNGSFEDIAGTLVLDEENINGSSVQATIKAASISTGSKRREAQLKSADFLEADRYPNILFRSTQVEPGLDRDTLRVTGDLTIKDKTRPIVLAVDVIDRSRSPQGEEVVYYTATTEIDRRDFGMKHGRLMTGRKLAVVINVQAVRNK